MGSLTAGIKGAPVWPLQVSSFCRIYPVKARICLVTRPPEPWPLCWNLGGHWGLALWRLWLGLGGCTSSHGAPWDARSYKRGMSTFWKENITARCLSERITLFHGPEFESTGVHSVLVTSYSFPQTTFSVDVTLGLVQSHCDYWLFFGGLDWSHGMFCRNHDETVRVVNDPLQAWK